MRRMLSQDPQESQIRNNNYRDIRRSLGRKLVEIDQEILESHHKMIQRSENL